MKSGRDRSQWILVLMLVVSAMSGCMADHPQSSLHPAGPAAQSIGRLWWFLFFLLTAVFMITILLTLMAIMLGRDEKKQAPPMGATGFVVVSGIVLPAVILVAIMLYSLGTTRALGPRDTDFTIRVVGHKWWWEVHYPEHGITTANELVIPVDRAVRFELISLDVIHSFWIPNLGGKLDMMPEHWTSFWLKAARPGSFRGQCAEYCGLQHALMAFTVEAIPEEEFLAWVEQRQKPAAAPDSTRLEQGRAAFFHTDAGCYTCHALEGTSAVGTLGPDLTHIGARPTLGAGTVPNTRENLRQWIVNSHVFKPGNRMPPTIMNDDDLDALVEYMMSLR